MLLQLARKLLFFLFDCLFFLRVCVYQQVLSFLNKWIKDCVEQLEQLVKFRLCQKGLHSLTVLFDLVKVIKRDGKLLGRC